MRWVGVLVLLVLGAALWIQRGADTAMPEAGRSETLPRYSADTLKAVRTDATGQPQLAVRAAHGDYYADGSARFTDITALGLSGSAAPWQLTSPVGTVPPKEKRLLLHAPVSGTGRWPNGEPLTFRGADVWVDQQRRQFSSDAPVSVVSPTRTANGKGFVAGFDGQTLTMKNVELQYELGNSR